MDFSRWSVFTAWSLIEQADKFSYTFMSWRENIFALLALCEANPWVTWGICSQKARNLRDFIFSLMYASAKSSVNNKPRGDWDAIMRMWCHCNNLIPPGSSITLRTMKINSTGEIVLSDAFNLRIRMMFRQWLWYDPCSWRCRYITTTASDNGKIFHIS